MVSIRWDSVSVAGIVSTAAGVERIEELGGWGWEDAACELLVQRCMCVPFNLAVHGTYTSLSDTYLNSV